MPSVTVVVTVDRHAQVKISVGHCDEELTPLQAERHIRDVRRAIDGAAAANRPRRKLGDY